MRTPPFNPRKFLNIWTALICFSSRWPTNGGGIDITAYNDIPDLHRRAGDWYEQNGLIGETINHLLEAGEFERAANFISKNALTFVYHGNLGTLARWLEVLPKNVKQSQPWLSIAHAWALSFAGQLAPVASILQDAEGALPSITDEIEVQRLSGMIDALRA